MGRVATTSRLKEKTLRMSEMHKQWIKEHGHPWTGRKHSDETKKRMSEAQKGRVSWAKGKKFTTEHREKMSDYKKKHPTTKWCYERWMVEMPKMIRTAILHEDLKIKQPYNNHSWKKLRRKIYNRDDFVCQECNLKCDTKTGIACHHIDFTIDNNKCDNLITLCSSCHGKTTSNPDFWIQYFQDKMMLKIKEK